MAIYHFSVKTISRSQGRSATAAIAYRAGKKITDEQTGEIHDYTKKQGVLAAEIVLPTNAPEWAKDRGKLWNEAERAETRKNSTVAREIIVALPAELDDKARYRMVKKFSEKLVDKHQCAVDFAIHAPSRDGDNRNYHAHLLLSTRQLTESGFDKKTREWDDRKSKTVDYWRAEWAKHVNRYLAQNNQEARVTHLSLREQGIDDREPTQHKGVALTAMERRERKAIMDNPDLNFFEKSRERRKSQRQKQKTELPEPTSGYNFGHIAGKIEDYTVYEDINIRIEERELNAMKTEQRILYDKRAALERMENTFPHLTDNQVYGVLIIAGEIKEITISRLDKAHWEVEDIDYFSKDFSQQERFISSVNRLMDEASTEQGRERLEGLGKELKLNPELPQSVDEYISKRYDWWEGEHKVNFATEIANRAEEFLAQQKAQKAAERKAAEERNKAQAAQTEQPKAEQKTEQPKQKKGRSIRH